jgi:hypothetical protein
VIAPLLLLLAQAAAPEPATTPTPPEAPAAPATITSEKGPVRAQVSCEPARDSTVFCSPTLLEIFRAGERVLQDFFPGEKSFVVLPGGDRRHPLAVEDLDGNGELEILLDLYSGGAHCCSSTRIYHRSGDPARYQVLTHDWGNPGYRLEDLEGDRRLEFVTGDDAFSGAFTSYAASRRPPVIFRFDGKNLEDVTRRYPKLIEQDATGCWKAFQELSPKDPTGDDVRGVAAAFLADEFLLERGSEGWRRLIESYNKPDRKKFFAELTRFLEKHGYATRPD